NWGQLCLPVMYRKDSDKLSAYRYKRQRLYRMHSFVQQNFTSVHIKEGVGGNIVNEHAFRLLQNVPACAGVARSHSFKKIQKLLAETMVRMNLQHAFLRLK